MNLNANLGSPDADADVEARATYGWRSGLFYWRLTTRGAGLHLAVEQRSRHPLRDLADTPRAELLQRRRTGRVMRLDAGSLGLSDRLVFKEDLYPLRSVLRSPFTRPRVLKEFEDLERLADRGLPTVDALACGWEGLWPFFRRTYLVTREFESAMSLRHWWRGGRDDSGALTLEEVVGLLGDLMPPLARLHNDGFWISTLRGKNILVRRGPSGPELALCDTSRVRRRGRDLHRRGAVRDLASLDMWAEGVLSDTQRLHLLNRYLIALGEPQSWKGWVTPIERRRDRLRHETRIGRLSRRSRRLAERIGLGPVWPL